MTPDDPFKPSQTKGVPSQVDAAPIDLAPDEARRDPDDPLTGKDGVGTFEGKTVFSPNELNQAGEDKEYFHPDEGHRFRAPGDADKHALKPSLDMRPGATDPTPELKRD